MGAQGPSLPDLLGRLQRVTKTSTGWLASCPVPGHGKGRGDHNPSLHISEGSGGKVLVRCHAGCDQAAVWAAIRELMGGGQAPSSAARAPLPPIPPAAKASGRKRQRPPLVLLTVDELARAKGFKASDLTGEDMGLRQDGKAVHIPYRLEDGSAACRQRMRGAVAAGDGGKDTHVFWWSNDTEELPVVPYGLWLLPKMRRDSPDLILVEGESDSWSLWLNGYPALGIAGAKMSGTLEAAHLKGFERLFLFKEPDAGGEEFVQSLARRLHELNGRWSHENVYIVVPVQGEGKDPNELYCQDPAQFAERFRRMLDRASPLDIASWVRPETETATAGGAGAAGPPNQPAAERAQPAEPVLATLNLAPRTAKTLLEEDLPPRVDVITGVLPRGGLGLLLGSPKAGKSILALQLAIAVIRNEAFLNLPTRQNKTLLLSAEGGPDLLRERLAKMTGPDRRDLDRLHLWWPETRSLRLDLQEDRIAIAEYCRAQGIGLLLVDPLVRHHVLDENSTRDMSELMAGLAELRRQSGSAVLLVHHTRKPGRDARTGSALEARGSSVLFGECDGALMLDRRKATNDFTLHAELRWAPEPAPLILELEEKTLTFRVAGLVEPRSKRVPESEVLGRLRRAGEISVGDFAALLGIAERTARNYLDELKKQGLAECRRSAGRGSPYLWRATEGMDPGDPDDDDGLPY